MAGGLPNACPLCDAGPLAADQGCARCGATADAVDLASAYQTAKACFRNWQVGLTAAEIDRICQYYDDAATKLRTQVRTGGNIAILNLRGRCWDCSRPVQAGQACPACGATGQHAALTTLRHLQRLCYDLNEHKSTGRLPLNAVHAVNSQAQERIAALSARLRKEARGAVARSEASEQPLDATLVPEPEAVSPPPVQETDAPSQAGAPPLGEPDLGFVPERKAAAPPKPRAPRRSAWEILLDPRSLQWLLGLGGALLVVGLVIWLATLGVFDNAYVVAGCLAVANGALLAGGWFLITQTRFQTAGRAVTLLACLVMPLNLWFYSAQSLLTLDGHLWVAAVVICALYAVSAYVLRDSLFVYVLHGGVALAGLLMLADYGRFAEIGAPAALLIVLALISIHVERAFPEGKGPFARHDFGMAFFWSGQVLLTSGLLFLLGGQLTGGWFYEPLFKPMYEWIGGYGQPYIVTNQLGQMLALGLVVAGMYGYLYSDLVVRRVGFYMYGVVFTLLWAEVLAVELLQLQVTLEVVIFVLAGTSLAINVLASQLGKQAPAILRAGPPLGFALTLLPVLLGFMLHLRSTFAPLNELWLTADGARYEVSLMYASAMVFTAVVCRFGAYVYRRQEETGALYFVGTAAATLLAAAAILSLVGVKTWAGQAPLVMLIPIAYMAAARFYRGHSSEKLVLVGQLATAVMLFSVIGAALHVTPEHMWEPATGKSFNLLLAVFFAEAAVFYVLAATVRPWAANAYLAAAAFAGALWQLLNYWNVSPQWYTLVFAVIGFVLLVAYRLAAFDKARLAEPAYQAANAIMSLSFVAALLQTLSRLASGSIQRTHDWSIVLLLGSLVLLSLGAAALVRQKGWRGWYITTAVLEGLLMFLTLHLLTELNGWQKLELFLTVVGVALLVAGHIGWFREQRDDRHSDNVGFALTLGSLLAVAPLTIGLIYYRLERDPTFSLAQGLHEAGVLGMALLLLVAGGLCQVRSTVFSGAAALTVFMLTLLLYVHIPEHLKTVGMMLTLAGGSLFTVALVLSMYRDSLVQLPEKIKRREGIFQVLSWR